mgnify:CR=1 FL=1
MRYGCFLEAFRDGRRSGGRQPALRRPGALRRRTTGSPTADSFVSRVQYLFRNRNFFHGSESKCSIAPATDAQDRRQKKDLYAHETFQWSAVETEDESFEKITSNFSVSFHFNKFTFLKFTLSL